MKNLKKEDIYDWVKNYLPSYLNTDYDIDALIELYQRGKDILGKFKIGDIISYDWQYPPRDGEQTYTGVAIFNCYKRDESGDVCMNDNYFIFSALISDTNIYDINDDRVSIDSNFVCMDDMRLASDEEKKFFFEKIKKYINYDNFNPVF